MAELLVYNTDHWMDAYSRADFITTYGADRVDQYDARYQRGDIVEVREDGYWTAEKGFNKAVFCVVCIDDAAKESSVYLQQPAEDGSLKRTYAIDTKSLIFSGNISTSNTLATVTIVNKEATATTTAATLKNG
jgi:hypothetical protein